jgi:hypothetical protein
MDEDEDDCNDESPDTGGLQETPHLFDRSHLTIGLVDAR